MAFARGYSRILEVALLALAARGLRAQTSGVLGISVIDGESGRPLGNAEVIDRSTGRIVTTGDDGVVRLSWGHAESLLLRVREIGYHFSDTTVVRARTGATVTIPLWRVTYTLAPVPVTSRNDCDFGADTANARLAAVALEQLRMGAERYDSFRRQHPFRVQIERRTREFREDGTVTRETLRNEGIGSDAWGERYSRGKVVYHERTGFSVPLLFIANLADPVFWQSHCFEVTNIEALGAYRVIRLSFWPTPDVMSPDWEGSALLDSATSELRRIEFRLANVGQHINPHRLEGYTTFSTRAPYVVVPESTAAIWWRTDAPRDSTFPDVLQVLLVKELRYRSTDKRP